MYEKIEKYTVKTIPETGFEVIGIWKDDIHDIQCRLVFDFDNFEIVAAEAHANSTPFNICPQGLKMIGRIIGDKVGPGFNRLVNEKLMGKEGCVHLGELVMNSTKALIQASSRQIPAWVDDEFYAQRWRDWITMYKDHCIYFSQPGIFENSQDEIQMAFRKKGK